MAPHTVLARSVAWNRWCAWCNANKADPLQPTSATVLGHVNAICESSTRPQGNVSAFRTTVRLLGQFLPHFAEVDFDKLAESDQRVIRGAVRSHTTTAPHRDADVDIARVLQWLRGECAAAETAAAHLLAGATVAASTATVAPTASSPSSTTSSSSASSSAPAAARALSSSTSTSPSPSPSAPAASAAGGVASLSSDGANAAMYRRLRNLAIAAFSALIPSRPSEVAGLCRSDVVVEVPPPAGAPAGTPPTRARLDLLARENRCALLAAGARFHLVVTLRRSKTDQLLSGIVKRMEHRESDVWSAARTLLLADLAGEAVHRAPPPPPPTVTKKGNARATARIAAAAAVAAPLFFVTDPLSRLGQTLDNDTPSNVLADIAERATGTRSKGRAWRASAASWLLTSGVDTETVAALGGWSGTKALRLHYVRAAPMREQVHRTVLGANDQSSAAKKTDDNPESSSSSSSSAGSAVTRDSQPIRAAAAAAPPPSRRSTRRTAGKAKPFFSPQ